jgi:hypothetical protein
MGFISWGRRSVDQWLAAVSDVSPGWRAAENPQCSTQVLLRPS